MEVGDEDYPLGTRVRVSWTPLDPHGYHGTIVYTRRWTAIGWEARVRRDGLEALAEWVPGERVTPLSAIDLLGDLAKNGSSGT